MPIAVACSCGRALTLRDELAGKLIVCPSCSRTVLVPEPLDKVEVVDAPPAAMPQGKILEGVAAGPPPLPPRVPEVVAEPPPRSRRDEPTKRRKRRRGRRFDPDDDDGTYSRRPIGALDEWFGVNGGIVGGLLCIAIGVLMFFMCLSVGRIWLVPIVFIVIGVIAVIKGLVSLL